jgi:Zinc finger, C2H2 type.
MTLKSLMGLFLYECPVCNRIFKTWRNANYHLKKHHPNVRMRNMKRISSKTYEYVETKYEE